MRSILLKNILEAFNLEVMAIIPKDTSSLCSKHLVFMIAVEFVKTPALICMFKVYLNKFLNEKAKNGFTC